MIDGEKGIRATLAQRFGEEVAPIPAEQGPYRWPQSCPETWRHLAGRGSCRQFAERPVAPELIETLCALALCAPTKSDLQQRDIVIVEEAARTRIKKCTRKIRHVTCVLGRGPCVTGRKHHPVRVQLPRRNLARG